MHAGSVSDRLWQIDPRFMLTLVEPGTYRWGFWDDLESEELDLTPLGHPMPLGG